MIRTIVYDAVGTLLHVVPSVAEIYASVGQRFGSRRGPDEVRLRFHAAFAEQERLDETLGWRTSEERERQRWREVVLTVLDDALPPTACFETLWTAFSKPHCWQLAADAARVLHTLSGRGIRQAIASNFDLRLRGILTALPIAGLLDPVVISSEIGWRKPSPQFFAQLLSALGVPASEVLFVGDDLINDFDAARRAGMQALLLDPTDRHRDVGEARIARLAELLALDSRASAEPS